MVVTEDSAVELPLHAPADLSQANRARRNSRRERRDPRIGFRPRQLSGMRRSRSGRPPLRAQTGPPAGGLPLGYHDVHVSLGGLRQATRLIVAPDRAYAHPTLANGGKAAGMPLALYGVRSARNWGCGDLRDLHGVIDWIADDAQASFVALNPLHAIYNRRPYNTSPYLPECIFYPNYLYLDVESIADFQQSRRAQRLWSQPETQRQLGAPCAMPNSWSMSRSAPGNCAS